METLVIGASRTKAFLLLLASLGFVGAGVAMLLTPQRSPEQRWIAWACILFFGAGVVVAAQQIADSRPRLVIDDQGILDRTLGVGVIPWSEILDAHVRSVSGNDFICLTVQNPELWLHKYSPVQRALVRANLALGFSELNINLAGIAAETTRIHELILKLSALHRRPGAGS
jgi:hypothetical protein